MPPLSPIYLQRSLIRPIMHTAMFATLYTYLFGSCPLVPWDLAVTPISRAESSVVGFCRTWTNFLAQMARPQTMPLLRQARSSCRRQRSIALHPQGPRRSQRRGRQASVTVDTCMRWLWILVALFSMPVWPPRLTAVVGVEQVCSVNPGPMMVTRTLLD